MIFRCQALSLMALGALACPVLGQAPPPPSNPPRRPQILDNPVPPKVLLPAPATLPAEAPGAPLSADEAARIALRLSPMLRGARAQVEAAQGRTQQLQAGSAATLGLSLTYSHVNDLHGSSGSVSGVPGVGGLPAGYQAGVTVRQLLFDFNHLRLQIRQSQLTETVAQQNLSRAQHDLVWQVKVAYYQFNGAKKLVAVYEENVANRQRQRDLAQARLSSGVGLPSDLVTAEAALGDAILGLQSAQNSMNLARVNLLNLMGVDARTPLELAESSEPKIPLDNLEGLVATGLERRPELLAAKSALEAQQSALKAARASGSPTVTGLLGTLGRGVSNPVTNQTAGIGVSIQFTPFDGGLVKGRVAETQGALAVAQAELETTRLQVITDISQAYLNLRTAEQQVATSSIGMNNAREGVRIAEGRYKAGLGTFLDIVNAQALLLSTTISQASAFSNVKQSTAALNRAIGGSI